ncbi:MAG: NUDIX domain-containing protein [Bacteroidia bacterium]
MKLPNTFNLRVYGLCVVDGALLVAEEKHHNTAMRKFPGGGLEFGEGLKECLVREWREELDVAIEVPGDIFYANDFLITSRFDGSQQVVAMFYRVNMLEEPGIPITDIPMNYDTAQNGDMSFRFIPLSEVQPEDFTFPADQAVVRKLLSEV